MKWVTISLKGELVRREMRWLKVPRATWSPSRVWSDQGHQMAGSEGPLGSNAPGFRSLSLPDLGGVGVGRVFPAPLPPHIAARTAAF